MRWILVVVVSFVISCANPYQAPCFQEEDCRRTPVNVELHP